MARANVAASDKNCGGVSSSFDADAPELLLYAPTNRYGMCGPSHAAVGSTATAASNAINHGNADSIDYPA